MRISQGLAAVRHFDPAYVGSGSILLKKGSRLSAA